MADSLAGVALAAGAGTRLRPLTILLPKVLCPVGNRPLIDHALARLDAIGADIAVNVHHGAEALTSHLRGRVKLSIEEPEALGTAGALGALREWIDGRAVVVVNADTWCPGGLDRLVDGWSGRTVRILTSGAQRFGPRMAVAGAAMPWSDVEALAAVPSGLYEVSWRQANAEGRVETVVHDGPCVDCGTPAEYLGANLTWSGGEPVIGPGARVEGTVVESVVWPDAVVHAGERLYRAIRTDADTTVLVRPGRQTPRRMGFPGDPRT